MKWSILLLLAAPILALRPNKDCTRCPDTGIVTCVEPSSSSTIFSSSSSSSAASSCSSSSSSPYTEETQTPPIATDLYTDMFPGTTPPIATDLYSDMFPSVTLTSSRGASAASRSASAGAAGTLSRAPTRRPNATASTWLIVLSGSDSTMTFTSTVIVPLVTPSTSKPSEFDPFFRSSAPGLGPRQGLVVGAVALTVVAVLV